MIRWMTASLTCLIFAGSAVAELKAAVVPGNSKESRYVAQSLESHLTGVTLIERAQLSALYEESKLQQEALSVQTPDFLILVETHYQSRYASDRYEIAAGIKVVRANNSQIVYATTFTKIVADRKFQFHFFVPQLSQTLPLNLDFSTTESAAIDALAKDAGKALNAVFAKLAPTDTGAR